MSLQQQWRHWLGDECTNDPAFYNHLAVAVAVLHQDAFQYLMVRPEFERWLSQVHDIESVWLATHISALVDPTPEDWHQVVAELPLLQRAELSALRPYSANAAHYYRHFCDERADEIDCNDVFGTTMNMDKVHMLNALYSSND